MQNISSFFRRLLVFVVIALGSAAVCAAADGGITIDVRNATPAEVFKIIESQSDYRISYRTQLIDNRNDISIKKTDASVESVLDAALAGRDLGYRIVSPRSIVIVEKNASGAAPQKSARRKITGRVTDSEGEPVIGASIVAGKATAVTDADGNWTLEVADGTRDVHISYVGCEAQRLPIGAKTHFDTVLRESSEQLDAVVVVGYGVQKKSVVTAAISSVKADQMAVMTPTRMDNVLKGMVSGVSITSSSGQPGDGNRIRIRGTGTINDSNPLYIVDGTPVNGGIDYINPADIESVEVLKDAASAAIYGSRGANGVILVTTKRGVEGKTNVTYDFSYGFQNPWRKIPMLNATEYATLMNEMNMNDGLATTYADPQALGAGTNWQNEVFDKDSPIINHQLGISGGNGRINYYVSASYLYQEGIVGGSRNHSNYERFTVRNNNNYTLFDAKEQRDWLRALTMGTNIVFSHDRSRGITNNSERGSVLGSALSISPTLPVYAQDPELTLAQFPHAVCDENGRPFNIPGVNFAAMPNPLALLYMPCDVNKTDRIVGNVFAELELYTNLKWRTCVSADLSIYTNDGFTLPYYLNSTRQSETSETWSTITKGWSWQVENTLAYTLDVRDRHHFNFLLGQSASMAGDQYVSGTSYLIRDPSQPWIDATDQDAKLRSASGAPSPQSRLASLFGRVGYNFDERYLFEFTIRRDGSSKFSPENKWANFPSVSAGWNITNEPFMERRPLWLTYMKLRASWGKNGNLVLQFTGGAFPIYRAAVLDNGALYSMTLPYEVVRLTDTALEISAETTGGETVVISFSRKPEGVTTADMLCAKPWKVIDGGEDINAMWGPIGGSSDEVLTLKPDGTMTIAGDGKAESAKDGAFDYSGFSAMTWKLTEEGGKESIQFGGNGFPLAVGNILQLGGKWDIVNISPDKLTLFIAGTDGVEWPATYYIILIPAE